jgi:hypothetical protein
MKKHVLILFLSLAIISCSTSNSSGEENQETQNPTDNSWLIPISEVKDGGPGKDGIPSIDNPDFVSIVNASFLNDDDLVVGIVINNEAKAYPHIIMDWHEIVNDNIGNDFFTLNYCPLTGTAFAWESMSNGVKSTFGVSGLLYSANLIMYDRNTDSNWSQLRLECVNGSLINDEPVLLSVVETDWKTWKTLYPNTKVLSTETGFSRSYGNSPYGDYSTNNSRFIFRPDITNSALPNKDRVYSIIDDNKSKVYEFSSFTGGKIIKDNFNNKNYLVVGNENVINAFELSSEYANVTFEYKINASEGTIFKDDLGNTWSLFGEAVSGPNTGNRLNKTKAVVSYWFAIAAFYPNPEIYSEL